MHGKRDTINVLKRVVLFNNIPDNFKAVRYHSLVAGAANNYVTAISHSDNEIMAFEDKKNMLFGVQFHPESFLSDFGAEIAINFINFCKEAHEVKV
jgi:anthranilate synthase component 2